MADSKQTILNRLILLQCGQGKAEGFETLVKSWEQPLFYYVRRMAGSEEDAWDVMQEVWLRAFRGITSVREPGALGAWLYRIAHNAVLNRLQRSPRWEPLNEDAEVAESVEDDLPMGFAAQDIHRALDELPGLEREALTLYFLEGYQLSEIAEIVEAPLGTVKSRMFRAKKNMRAVLEKGERRHD